MVALLIAACVLETPEPTPEEAASALVEVVLVDFDAGLAAMAAEEDPTVLVLATVWLVDRHAHRLTPEQGSAVCEVAARAMPVALCNRRFGRPHLR